MHAWSRNWATRFFSTFFSFFLFKFWNFQGCRGEICGSFLGDWSSGRRGVSLVTLPGFIHGVREMETMKWERGESWKMLKAWLFIGWGKIVKFWKWKDYFAISDLGLNWKISELSGWIRELNLGQVNGSNESVGSNPVQASIGPIHKVSRPARCSLGQFKPVLSTLNPVLHFPCSILDF